MKPMLMLNLDTIELVKLLKSFFNNLFSKLMIGLLTVQWDVENLEEVALTGRRVDRLGRLHARAVVALQHLAVVLVKQLLQNAQNREPVVVPLVLHSDPERERHDWSCITNFVYKRRATFGVITCRNLRRTFPCGLVANTFSCDPGTLQWP